MSPTEIATLHSPRTAVALLAGGTGTRMGAEVPKPLLPIMGHPLIHYSLRLFECLPGVCSIRVGIHPLHGQTLDKLLAPYPRRLYRGWVPGGATRALTALAVLEALSEDRPDMVLIHDAARPCVSMEDVMGLLDAMKDADGAFLACPPVDTLWTERGGEVSETVDRRGILCAQTPQVFLFDTILEAYRKGLADGFEGTDDASFVRRLGKKVLWAPGSRWNIKVTYPEDIPIAQALLTGVDPCA
jgi:2-C-methyl-D-erythritol 4-phosphate cytidylyltransferase